MLGSGLLRLRGLLPIQQIREFGNPTQPWGVKGKIGFKYYSYLHIMDVQKYVIYVFKLSSLNVLFQ